MRRGHSEPVSRGQQVIDIGSDLPWIRIPFALPVAVYLPIWTRKFAIVGSTPLANCIVRSAQTAIRPEMRCPCHGASGRCGTDDLALLGKRSIKLHSDLQANAAVPIDRDVATGSRLLRTHCIPDQPTALRHDARKLGCTRLPSDDCEGHTIELVELDCRGRQWTLPYCVKMASAVTPRRTAEFEISCFCEGTSTFSVKIRRLSLCDVPCENRAWLRPGLNISTPSYITSHNSAMQ
jgi:hypothetical protein